MYEKILACLEAQDQKDFEFDRARIQELLRQFTTGTPFNEAGKSGCEWEVKNLTRELKGKEEEVAVLQSKYEQLVKDYSLQIQELKEKHTRELVEKERQAEELKRKHMREVQEFRE
mmetsp:Transcript_14704/g.10610  ORF Transcript_14704/g.10610 Transcript_14704/m.10610 type:complete len:116 (+) Transcript_14704:240-587(+)